MNNTIKKLTSLAVVFALSCPALAAVVSGAALGDVNGDGSINVSDISLVAAHVKSIKMLADEQFSSADIDGSGTVNVSDISLLAAAVKGKKPLPEGGGTQDKPADIDTQKLYSEYINGLKKTDAYEYADVIDVFADDISFDGFKAPKGLICTDCFDRDGDKLDDLMAFSFADDENGGYDIRAELSDASTGKVRSLDSVALKDIIFSDEYGSVINSGYDLTLLSSEYNGKKYYIAHATESVISGGKGGGIDYLSVFTVEDGKIVPVFKMKDNNFGPVSIFTAKLLPPSLEDKVAPGSKDIKFADDSNLKEYLTNEKYVKNDEYILAGLYNNEFAGCFKCESYTDLYSKILKEFGVSIVLGYGKTEYVPEDGAKVIKLAQSYSYFEGIHANTPRHKIWCTDFSPELDRKKRIAIKKKQTDDVEILLKEGYVVEGMMTKFLSTGTYKNKFETAYNEKVDIPELKTATASQLMDMSFDEILELTGGEYELSEEHKSYITSESFPNIYVSWNILMTNDQDPAQYAGADSKPLSILVYEGGKINDEAAVGMTYNELWEKTDCLCGVDSSGVSTSQINSHKTEFYFEGVEDNTKLYDRLEEMGTNVVDGKDLGLVSVRVDIGDFVPGDFKIPVAAGKEGATLRNAPYASASEIVQIPADAEVNVASTPIDLEEEWTYVSGYTDADGRGYRGYVLTSELYDAEALYSEADSRAEFAKGLYKNKCWQLLRDGNTLDPEDVFKRVSGVLDCNSDTPPEDEILLAIYNGMRDEYDEPGMLYMEKVNYCVLGVQWKQDADSDIIGQTGPNCHKKSGGEPSDVPYGDAIPFPDGYHKDIKWGELYGEYAGLTGEAFH